MPKETTLSTSTQRAAVNAVKQLAGSPEWANLIRVFRAEAGTDGDMDACLDFVSGLLTKQLLDQMEAIAALRDAG